MFGAESGITRRQRERLPQGQKHESSSAAIAQSNSWTLHLTPPLRENMQILQEVVDWSAPPIEKWDRPLRDVCSYSIDVVGLNQAIKFQPAVNKYVYLKDRHLFHPPTEIWTQNLTVSIRMAFIADISLIFVIIYKLFKTSGRYNCVITCKRRCITLQW